MLPNFLINFLEGRFLKRCRALSEYSKVISSADKGRGVELSEDISEGTLLGIYPGEHLSLSNFLGKEDFVNKSVKSAYLHSEDRIIDPTDIFGFVKDTPNNRIALINEPSENEAVNIIPVSSNKHVWYVAISDVPAGKQLFTSYGHKYERDYRTRQIDFTSEQLKCLKQVSLKYCWLRNGLKEVLEN